MTNKAWQLYFAHWFIKVNRHIERFKFFDDAGINELAVTMVPIGVLS
ncbi:MULTISPECIES: hypothetical protein [Pseudoalteromonas]|nr:MULTISPECIES: hypothetical protein [Pseudoalteromonas]MDI4653387.1 hypothetical protein [Pseudoalteromonas shioyasakiensis]NUJ39674.1 hypothetical protein [Pseudoalteromonas sp. 0303]